MATTSAMLADPDFMELYKAVLANSRWQNQLASGLNIANAGWKTGLGLALGTGLGNWLGYKFGNWQQARDDDFKYGLKNNPAAQAAVNNLFGGDVDLGWTPQYQFKTPQEYFLDAVKYNPNWRNAAYNNALPKYQSAMTGFLPPKPQPTAAPAVSTTPQPAIANPPTSTPTQQNFTWGYRPLTEGTLKPKPAMSIQGALDNVFPYYGLSGW